MKKYMAIAFLITLILIFIPENTHAFIEDSAMVPMTDGTNLATQIYLPTTYSSPLPVVLQRTPYNRHDEDFALIICDLFGYAFVCQNLRGTRDSEGDPMMFISDGWGDYKDGYDCIDWVVSQDFCNGRVGMMGASAPGMTQYFAAGAMHPNLTMICPILAGPSLYHQVAYQGGVLRRVLVENWLDGVHTPWLMDTIANHPLYDTMWSTVDLSTMYDEVDIPTFHVSGWYDMYTDGQLEAFTEMQSYHGNNKLLIAPCGHGDAIGTTEQGDIEYPDNALVGEDDLIQVARRWYDYWLKDSPTGIMEEPAVMFYLTGDCTTEDTTLFNHWVFTDEWPPPSTENVNYYLHSTGIIDTVQPSDSSAMSYDYDPEDPCPTIGGREFIGMDDIGYGPKDQADDVETRDDVLIFSTPILTEPVAVIGKIKMVLFASSDRLDTDFAIRITDVYPDDRSILMTDGILRARFRHGFDHEDFLTPGEPDTIEIDVWSIGHVFNTGHRIRAIVTSSNYPRFEKNPNTGASFTIDDPTTMIAHNTIYMSPDMPTHLILPIHPIDTTTSIEELAINKPSNIAIDAYPNPFNSAIKIKIASENPIESIEIFDINGRIIDIIPSELIANEIVWAPSQNAPSGIYLLKVSSKNSSLTKRIMYVR